MFDKPGDPSVPPSSEPAYPPPPGPPWAPAAPGPAWAPAPVPTPRQPGSVAAAAGVVAFAVAVAGLFVLPLEHFGIQDVGFAETRNFAATTSNYHGRIELYSGLASFWWRFGALIATAALVVLLAVVVARPPLGRVLGWIVAGLAAASGVVLAVSLGQSAGARGVLQFQGTNRTDMYDDAGIGVWIAFVGFGLLAAAGVFVALTGRRPRVRPAPGAVPPPSQPWPAAPPS